MVQLDCSRSRLGGGWRKKLEDSEGTVREVLAPAGKKKNYLSNRGEPLNATRIEGRATLAFQPDHMESPRALVMAILADVGSGDIGSSRHGRGIPFLTEKLKVGVHVDNAARALWTRVESRFEVFAEAMLVHRVPTLHYPSLLARVEQVLEANGAVMITGSLNTLVLALQLDAVAHGARVTMVKSFSSSDTAEPAFIAMEYLLLLRCIVKEVALVAEIGANRRLARGAFLGDRLPRGACRADHLLDAVPIHPVVRFLVMAEATRSNHAAARRHDVDAQLVVLARHERRKRIGRPALASVGTSTAVAVERSA